MNYSDKDLINHITIKRNKSDHKIYLTISKNKAWTLYTAKQAESIEMSKPILNGTGEGIFPIDVDNNQHYVFLIVQDNKKILLSEKHLPMIGGYNFRDLGGLRNTEGRFIKWGKLFRSDDLSNLTDLDLGYLSSIPLRTIVDFRSQQEIEKAPSRIPDSVQNRYHLSIIPGDIYLFEEMMKQPEEKMIENMKMLYRDLVSDDKCVSNYKRFFSEVQANNGPLMYHCSAGKDRTGVATALILSALGIDEKTITEDYLSSNFYLDNKYHQYKVTYPQITPLIEVREEYLKAAIDKIIEDHGSVNTFLKNILDVDVEYLKESFLY